jgi:alpha-L-fucosidase
MTMNNSWGYNPSDRHYKSVRSLINTLSEVATKGGRLLLNVGPRGDGSLAEEQAERLEAIAEWMARSGESIVGTQPGLEPWQFYGPSTRRENRVYLHLLARPYDTISVRGVHLRKIRAASVLASGEQLRIHRRGVVTEMMFNQDPVGELIIDVPENAIAPLQTVIALDFEP